MLVTNLLYKAFFTFKHSPGLDDLKRHSLLTDKKRADTQFVRFLLCMIRDYSSICESVSMILFFEDYSIEIEYSTFKDS